MATNEYLNKVLETQNLSEDSQELKELRARRVDVEALLCAKFGTSPHIRYGGSKAKCTMIRKSYDLDIAYYLERDDTVAGETLKEIFENVAVALEKDYFVERKRSALRLTSKQPKTWNVDLHIDVVPGRFIDGDHGDVFLYQNEGDKDRLETNLDVHIEHIGNSGVTDAIRLLKLWKVQNGLRVKTFVLELLIVDLLKGNKKKEPADQLEIVLTAFRDRIDELSAEDPANPNGNDLSKILDVARYELSTAAARTLQIIDKSGWEGVFGAVESDAEKRARLQSIASSIPSASQTKPWWDGE